MKNVKTGRDQPITQEQVQLAKKLSHSFNFGVFHGPPYGGNPQQEAAVVVNPGLALMADGRLLIYDAKDKHYRPLKPSEILSRSQQVSEVLKPENVKKLKELGLQAKTFNWNVVASEQ